MSSSRPNIVFFFTDDQRFDTVSALGNPAVRTPTMDRLVETGVAFTHAHIPGGTSGAVCMPSRAMLHSGRTLFHIEGAGQSIPESHTTLGEHLRANGYETFGTGKWHNGAQAFARSFSDGGEIFFGGMDDHWNVPAFDYDPTGRYDGRLPICKNPGTSKVVNQRRGDHVTAGKHSSELFCDAAIDFLDRRDSDKPFFMYISFMAPHDPRIMPQKYLDMYDPADVQLPPNFMGGHPFDNGDLKIRDEVLADFPRDPEEIKCHIAEYYAMITHLDAQMARVIAMLEEKGLADNTIIVFAGDNGLALGQHGLMGKQSNYDHSIRVPMVMSGPGIPRGVRSDAFAYVLDIYPTLCDLTGLPVPESVEGASLTPAMSNPDERIRDTLFFAYKGMHRAVRDQRYKLIEYVVRGNRTSQLFDLQNDPWETNDLSTDPACEAELAQLREVLFRWRDEWDDEQSEWGQEFWAGYR